MKKILLTILAVLAMSGMAMAQTAPSDVNLHRNEDGSWSFTMPGRNLVMSTETFSTNDTVNGHYLAGVPEGWLILALGDTVPVSNDSLRRTTPITEGTPVTIVPTGNLRRIKSITLVDVLPPATPLAAKLAYTGGEIADFTDATDDLTTMTWAVGEHIAILYEVSGTKKVADAEITAVDGTTGAATIEFTVEAGTPDNTPCTLVYPYDAAKDDHTGVKDAATLLAAQDGTLSANLDVRVGAGTIQTTTPGLTVNTQPVAQFAIFKFTTQSKSDEYSSLQNTSVTKLTVTIGAQNYVITPASATSTLYAALPAVDGQTVSFTATDGTDLYAASKASVSFAAVKYYQSTVKMGKVIEVFDMDEPYLVDFVGPIPQYHYLHIGLDQAYAIAKQLSTQNGGDPVAVVYNHDWEEVTYALSTDASATAHTDDFPDLFGKYNYRVFLATLWQEANM